MATSIELKERLISAPTVNIGNGIVAYAGYFERGNVDDFIVINSIQDLEDTVGKPTEDTINDFLVCYDLLQYGNQLLLQRIYDEDTAELARKAIASDGTETSIASTGEDTFFVDYHERLGGVDYTLEFWTKAPFDSSNSDNPEYKVYVAKYTGSDWAADASVENVVTGQTLSIGDTGVDFSDIFEVGPTDTNDDGETVNELAIVITEDGEVVESHLVSTVSGTKNAQGQNYFISDWLDANSDYIWGYVKATDYSSLPDLNSDESIMEATLADGSKGDEPTKAVADIALNKFANKDEIFFDYIIDGFHTNSRTTVQTIVGDRKDSVSFLSPDPAEMFSGTGAAYFPSKNMFPKRDSDSIVDGLITDVKSILTGDDAVKSRAAYYGNWKQVYNPYMDDFRWIPLSASAAGVKIIVNTNLNFWDVPAGDQGGLRNTERLAFEPTAAQRDKLYKNRVNDVYTDNVLGAIINGTKTLIDKNVGVSRLNIRETYRIIENFVLDNSKQFLHKFNDPVTRARFVGIVEPFLRDIVNRGGLVRFQVVADETNNTPLVINNYEFRAKIYLEGKRPIEKIVITVIDTPAGISFSELQA
jgi:hypothetical protein